MMWKDTIREVAKFGRYTLLEYVKGGCDEWCIALNYNPESKSWDSGTYCCSLESAMAECLRKMDSNLVKGKYQLEVERASNICYERMTELATVFKDGCDAEYIEDECELEDAEKEFFGIEEEDDDEWF